MRCPRLNELPPPPLGKTGWPWTEESSLLEEGADPDSFPLISVITPSFNQGEFIEETIRSVLLQGYPNLEYIIMDGGSTDNTVDIIRKYEHWITKWVSEPDRGQSHAVNKGFSESQGQILAWTNSDDTYEKNALSAVALLLLQRPQTDVVYGNVRIIDEHGRFMTELRSVPFDPNAFFYETVHIAAQSAVFWRRDLFFKVGMVDENFRFAMDRELLVRFINAGANFTFLRAVLGTYRCHTSSKTFGMVEKSKQELLKIEPFSQIKQRADYQLRRGLYRLRQLAFLAIQGDLPYLFARTLARVKPTAFDQH